MATIREYTTIEQSKKLTEILPLESANGFWEYHNMWYSEGDEWEGYEDYPRAEPYLEYTRNENEWKEDKSDVPCWSLAALLSVLPNGTNIVKEEADTENEKYMCTAGINGDIIPTFANNPIDACYEMILKLHELKKL